MIMSEINGGGKPVNNFDDIIFILNKQRKNFCIMSEVAQGYPQLALLINGDLATLTYVPEEGDPGYISLATEALDSPGSTTRFSMSDNQHDDLLIHNHYVVRFKDALRAAQEFFLAKTLPRAIEWFKN